MEESAFISLGMKFNMPISSYRKSTLVLASSLLFIIPAIVFAVNRDYMMAMAVAIACVFSVFGDYVYVGDRNLMYRNYDVISASLLFCIIIVRHFSNHPDPKPENLLPKIILPLSLLKYSSMATTQEEWELRHSMWHVAAVLVFLAEA